MRTIVMLRMDDVTEVQARWNQARHDLLNLLLEFHTQWNSAFAISHHCGHLKTPSIEKCRANLEKVWADIDGLDDLFRRYKKTIGEMKEIVRAMDVARMPQRPA